MPAQATCSSTSSALPAPLCWVFLEKSPFFTWTMSLLVSAQCNDCSTTAWLGQDVSPAVLWGCRENSEPRAENKQAAVGRRNSRVKGNAKWKPASHSRRAHPRGVTLVQRRQAMHPPAPGRCYTELTLPRKITSVSDRMCEYVSSLRLFLPKQSAAGIWSALCMLESSQQSPSVCWCRWQGSPRSFLVTVCQAPFPDYQFFTSWWRGRRW